MNKLKNTRQSSSVNTRGIPPAQNNRPGPALAREKGGGGYPCPGSGRGGGRVSVLTRRRWREGTPVLVTGRDGWGPLHGQTYTCMKTLPSPRTTYAGDKNSQKWTDLIWDRTYFACIILMDPASVILSIFSISFNWTKFPSF